MSWGREETGKPGELRALEDPAGWVLGLTPQPQPSEVAFREGLLEQIGQESPYGIRLFTSGRKPVLSIGKCLFVWRLCVQDAFKYFSKVSLFLIICLLS